MTTKSLTFGAASSAPTDTQRNIIPTNVKESNCEDGTAEPTPDDGNPIVRCQFCDWHRLLHPAPGSRMRRDGWASLRAHCYAAHRDKFDRIVSWAHESTHAKGRRPLDGERLSFPVWDTAQSFRQEQQEENYVDPGDCTTLPYPDGYTADGAPTASDVFMRRRGGV